jgi:hypothetical protein
MHCHYITTIQGCSGWKADTHLPILSSIQLYGSPQTKNLQASAVVILAIVNRSHQFALLSAN